MPRKNQDESKEKRKKKNNVLNNYAKYSNLAIQVIIILLGAIFGGRALDNYMEWQIPVFTLGFSLLAIVVVLYIFISSVSK